MFKKKTIEIDEDAVQVGEYIYADIHSLSHWVLFQEPFFSIYNIDSCGFPFAIADEYEDMIYII